VECILKLFDAHTHIDMKHFDNDRANVISRAKDAGVVGMVTSSIGVGSFRRTLGILKKYPDYVYHSAGCSVSQLTPDDANAIIKLTRKYQNDIVAVGEVGLDYHWIKDANARKAQEPLFLQFIKLAIELNLPLVVHSRKAEAEATSILEKNFSGPVLMHCYDGTSDVTKRIIDNGWSITLPANFSRFRNRIDAANSIPIEQILLETDGPYMSPTNNRNEPMNVGLGCKFLADLLNMNPVEVALVTTQNAKKFYNV
jgi:TatD DNase family protein